MNKHFLKHIIDMLCFVAGAVIYSIAVNVFLSPNGISPGGFTGIATVANFVAGIPAGIILFALNIPVLILGYIKMGGEFILKTTFVTTILSISLDLTKQIFIPLKTDGILAALFGGIIMGFGLSLVLLRGATSGGVDIIAKLINQRFRHLSVGKIILMADGFVITLTALAYKNVESALYSVVAMYAATRIMDTLLYGADKGKIIYIVTEMADEICQKITIALGRGVTRLEVVGGYTGKEKTMLLCVVRAYEAAAVHDIIKENDEKAFIVVGDVGEIIGEGFKMANHNML